MAITSSITKRSDSNRLPPASRILSLDSELSRYAQAIQPLQLFVGLSMTYHHAAAGFQDVCLCRRDAPVFISDCRRIQCVVPLGDRVMARKMVDEAIDGRLNLLPRHFSHRWCNVQAMRQKLERALETTRQFIREELDRLC